MSHPSIATMTAPWTNDTSADDERTVHCGTPGDAVDVVAVHQSFVNPYDDSQPLDANALFADLPGSPGWSAHVVPAPPLSYVAYEPPSSGVASLPIRRLDTATVRVRRPTDRREAHVATMVVCGALAFFAALAACFVYVESAERAPDATSTQLSRSPRTR